MDKRINLPEKARMTEDTTSGAETKKVEIGRDKSRKNSIGRKGKTPMAAIRNRCLDCCCWQPSEVRNCASEDCALWPYRFGKR